MSAQFQMSVGRCTMCGEQKLVGPIHGANGGPLACIPCGIEWHAKYTRRRKFGRIIVKAIKAFYSAGGSPFAIDRLKSAAYGFAYYTEEADTIGAECGDITSELLNDTIRLTHPDRHPPERQAIAQRVTQELVALKPFVFPAPIHKEPAARDGSKKVPAATNKDPLRVKYPCELCRDQVPYYYCNACKAEHDKRSSEKREREKAKHRKWYARRRERERARRKPATCQACGAQFKGRRKDAKYCSAACRQRDHRQRRVTAASLPDVEKLESRDTCREVSP